MNPEIERLRAVSAEIDNLYYSNKRVEAMNLLNNAVNDAKKISDAYYLFFLSEQSAYKKDYKKSLELLVKANELQRDDFFLLRALGDIYYFTSQYHKALDYYEQSTSIKNNDARTWQAKAWVFISTNKDEEALIAIDKALSIDPGNQRILVDKALILFLQNKINDSMVITSHILSLNANNSEALRIKGMCFNRQQKYEEAEKSFNAAIALDPDNYRLWRNKGITYKRQSRFTEAIECFIKALTFNSDDIASMCYLSSVYDSIGNHREASTFIKKAYKIDPESELVRYYYNLIQKDKAESKDIGLLEIMSFVDGIRDQMGAKVDDYLSKMKNTEKRIEEFLSPDSNLKSNESIFFVLRKWNSFTPIIPDSEQDRYVGGGYFIYHNGKGTVIDPGYNFLENFYMAGGKICDITNVVLTHAHNDHTNDFESILSLIHQYNKKNGLKPNMSNYRKVNIFLNAGCFKKFSGMLDLKETEYIENISILMPNHKYNVDKGFKIIAIPAYHDELIAKKYAVGLKLVFEKSNNQKVVLITSDTGLYPQCEGSNGELVADINGGEIWSKYKIGAKPINLLIPHIGSVKENELVGSTNSEDDIRIKLEESFYPNHLGIIGTSRVITKIKPKFVIISEFGEELNEFQEDLILMIKKVVERVLRKECPTIVAGDLSLIYNIFEETVYCIHNKKMVPVADVECIKLRNKGFFYHGKVVEQEKFKASEYAEDFLNQRQKRIGLYFKEQ